MAAVSYEAASKKAIQHRGQYGNASKFKGYLDGSQGVLGVSSGSDVVTVDLLELPSGSEISDFKVRWSALGTAASGKIGFRYKNPTQAAAEPSTTGLSLPTAAADYFLVATSMAAAGSNTTVLFAPVRFDLPVIVTLTVDTSSGTNIIPAAATVALILEGTSKGTP